MKMYFVNSDDVKKIERLFEMNDDEMFYELSSFNGYVDIAQYSTKYKEVHFVTVPRNKLNYNKCLGYRTKY